VTLPPRAVLVRRRTELQELLDRHGTRGQAAFFLASRGRQIDEVEARHRQVREAVAAVSAAVPEQWRRASVERAELSRFLFEPEDVIVVVGQDGLVANVAKYLDGQPVVGIDPEPGRNAGVLVTHPPSSVGPLLAAAVSAAGAHVEERCMVQADTDDGQRLVALNEVYFGHGSHQTARYLLTEPGGSQEAQASSGVIVATGTGATGWCRSAWLERHSAIELPRPAERRLAWFVREAWPSPATGTAHTEGQLAQGQPLRLTVTCDQLVLFGDGVEPDAITLAWGQSVAVGLSSRTLRLLR